MHIFFISELSSEKYKLVGVDLCDLSSVHEAFTKCGVNIDVPTLFVSEVSITYMPCDRLVPNH